MLVTRGCLNGNRMEMLREKERRQIVWYLREGGERERIESDLFCGFGFFVSVFVSIELVLVTLGNGGVTRSAEIRIVKGKSSGFKIDFYRELKG
ncbi:hypothetical protein NPIL_578411 [Nephila pilipes]|uniref:Uncharacterized protein n=1 Tax=Nephila pilipes TaxID=299642 RepID=A0A8X6TTB5_NEPPI|nr:hypothetical protein NPIL_578411 [Nephila pilipes]